jgi:hypothetical protein
MEVIAVQKITGLKIVFQKRVGPRARKDVVRKNNADGPYRNRELDIPADIEIGPNTGANLAVRRLISEHLKPKKEEILFYVVAEIDTGKMGKRKRGGKIERYRITYFKTIVPRSAIPV